MSALFSSRPALLPLLSLFPSSGPLSLWRIPQSTAPKRAIPRLFAPLQDNACARMLDPEASSFSLLHLGLLLCSLSSASALSCFWLRVSLRFGPLLAKMVSIGGYVLFSESRRENFHGPSSCGVSAAVVSPLMETVDGDCGFLEPLRRGGGALLYNSSQQVMVNSRRFNSRVFSVRLLSSLARVDYIASHKLPIFWFSISSKGIRIMVSVLVVSLLSRVHIPVLVVDRLVCDW
ncbi:hypothetical protein Bca4012_065481 [Brassica carinata]